MLKDTRFPLPSGKSFIVFNVNNCDSWSFFLSGNEPNYLMPIFNTPNDAIKAALSEIGMSRDEYMQWLRLDAEQAMLALLVMKKTEG